MGDCSVESRTWNFKLLDWSIQKIREETLSNKVGVNVGNIILMM